MRPVVLIGRGMMNSIRALTHNYRWQILFGLLIFALLCVLMAYWAQPAATHGSPIIDGAFTGDWCAPNFKGVVAPDSFTILNPPACSLGNEFMWDDWDLAVWGALIGPPVADVIGYLPPGGPLDTEIDLSFVATTADANNIYFAVALGMFPAPLPGPFGSPPNVQIAIDVSGPGPIGASVWYDPLVPPPPGGTGPLGMTSIPGPLMPDYLIVTDVLGPAALLFESLSAPGMWTLVGPVQQAWSGNGFPGVIEIAVPWGMFPPIPPVPPFVPGTPLFLTVMSAHSKPCPFGPSCAPVSPEDDVFTGLGPMAPPGMTTSPNVCPPGLGSSACELFPVAAPPSADAFVNFAYPLPDTPTPTPTETGTPTPTPTRTGTPTGTATPTPTRTGTPTATPTPTTELSLTPTLTATPVAGYKVYLPYVVKAP
jgi:hypothetical protein